MYTTINSVESKLSQLQGKAGQFISAEWVTYATPAAIHKKAGIILEKKTKAVIRTGVDFSNLKSVKDGIENGTRGEVQPLAWGEWKHFPYVKTHKGQDYFRVYPVAGTKPEVEYKVNGQTVDRDTFKSYLVPSVQDKMDSGILKECFEIHAENINFK